MTTAPVLGVDLHVGDTIEAIDGPHTIDHFAPYPGVFAGDTARRAYDATGHWCCTVADRETFHVHTPDGSAPC
jgi:hypothetical protein